MRPQGLPTSRNTLMFRKFSGWAGLSLLLATCSGARAQVGVDAPAPESATDDGERGHSGKWLADSDLAPHIERDVPTQANELEGDLRIAEPLARLERKRPDEGLHPLVMPVGEPAYPRVASRAKGSISVGTVTAGFLVQGAEIPLEGPNHRVLSRLSDRNTRFTTDEMRDLLLCAAKQVAREWKGQRLGVGNLSRQGGGPLPWSVSHHNGRDGDLAFYARTPTGAPAVPEHLYHFGRHLDAEDAPTAMRFDVGANWSLVKALLTCPNRPDIQHLFMASWLRDAILAHARQRKEPKELIAMAASVVAQPHGALPHDDHLHIRIGCTGDDQSEGCLDASRAPQEAVGRSPGVQARLGQVRAALRSGKAETRAGAIRLLALWRDEASVAAVQKLLLDHDPEVRLAAARALGEWRPAGAGAAVDAALDQEIDPAVVLTELRTLMQLDATAAVVARLQDFRVMESERFDVPTVVVRKTAAELLADTASFEVASAVVSLLTDDRMDVRAAARQTLARIANRTTSDLLSEPGLLAQLGLETMADMAAENLAQDLERVVWHEFLARTSAEMSRDALALQGMARRGIRVTVLDRGALPELVRALLLPNPYRDNAARWIERIAQQKPMIAKLSRANPAQFWPSWLVAKRLVSASSVAGVAPAGGTGLSADND